MVKQVNAATFEAEVLKNAKPVLVDFYADWCGPCKMTAPVLEKLSEAQDAVEIMKLNVDDSPEIAQAYQVMSIPNLVVFKDGQPAARAVGVQNLAGLTALIETVL